MLEPGDELRWQIKSGRQHQREVREERSIGRLDRMAVAARLTAHEPLSLTRAFPAGSRRDDLPAVAQPEMQV